MADTFPTLANLVKLNDKNANQYGCNDLLQGAPLLRSLYAMPASNGTDHKYLKRTTAPSAGSRAVNAGIARTFGADTLVTQSLAYYDADHYVDIALAKGHKDGAAAYIANEIPSQVQSLFYSMEQATITAFAAALASLGSMCITGSGSGSANSSIYAIRSAGPREVAAVMGNDGEVAIGETGITRVVDGSSNTFTAYITPIGAYYGVQLGSVYSLARLCNLSVAAGATDAKIAQLLNLAPSDRPFTHLVMNRRTLGQLQAARTATNPTGAPAPFPESAFNVPIIVTDAIGVAEATLT